jgi:aspartokinase
MGPDMTGEKQRLIVAKFGGSNLRETDDIRRLASVMREYKRPAVVVVSAFFGITNRMAWPWKMPSATNHLCRSGNSEALRRSARWRLSRMNRRSPQPLRTEATANERLEELERLLLGVRYLSDVPAGPRPGDELRRTPVLPGGEPPFCGNRASTPGRPCRRTSA